MWRKTLIHLSVGLRFGALFFYWSSREYTNTLKYTNIQIVVNSYICILPQIRIFVITPNP